MHSKVPRSRQGSRGCPSPFTRLKRTGTNIGPLFLCLYPNPNRALSRSLLRAAWVLCWLRIRFHARLAGDADLLGRETTPYSVWETRYAVRSLHQLGLEDSGAQSDHHRGHCCADQSPRHPEPGGEERRYYRSDPRCDRLVRLYERLRLALFHHDAKDCISLLLGVKGMTGGDSGVKSSERRRNSNRRYPV